MISLLTPTRKRPKRLWEMVESVVKTASVMPEILCYVADDDNSYDSIEETFGRFWPSISPTFVRGPRLTMSDLWNAIIPHAHGDIFMLCADDVIFRTQHWDVEIEKSFAESDDKIMLAFADDAGPSGKTFASLPFVHRRWVETVGYFTGPGFSADYSDTWPNDVADMIGRKKHVPVVIEHAHWIWNKAEKDVVYKENEERLRRDNCHLQYRNRLPERQADAAKLRAVMGTPWGKT